LFDFFHFFRKHRKKLQKDTNHYVMNCVRNQLLQLWIF